MIPESIPSSIMLNTSIKKIVYLLAFTVNERSKSLANKLKLYSRSRGTVALERCVFLSGIISSLLHS